MASKGTRAIIVARTKNNRSYHDVVARFSVCQQLLEKRDDLSVLTAHYTPKAENGVSSKQGKTPLCLARPSAIILAQRISTLLLKTRPARTIATFGSARR